MTARPGIYRYTEVCVRVSSCRMRVCEYVCTRACNIIVFSTTLISKYQLWWLELFIFDCFQISPIYVTGFHHTPPPSAENQSFDVLGVLAAENIMVFDYSTDSSRSSPRLYTRRYCTFTTKFLVWLSYDDGFTMGFPVRLCHR